MKASRAIGILLTMLGPGAGAAVATEGATPNDFFRRGMPTFVVGTAGDERSDREIRGQAELIRGLLFPTARIVEDGSIDPAKGPGAWPANPILYGGPQSNSLMAGIADSLPFRLGPGRLELGDKAFDGEDFRLIAVVPARAAGGGGRGPGYPEFLLYASTGSPGLAEINSIKHGPEPIVVADAFGRLAAGDWRAGGNGRLLPNFAAAPARRIAWRSVDRTMRTEPAGADLEVKVSFPAQLPAAQDEARVVEACLRGLETGARTLAITGTHRVVVYIYPDPRSKASLTGNQGDGHADAGSRTLHMVRFDPAVGGPLERLMAHEGTHVLTTGAWGPAGSSLVGEGVAVWVAGQYGGVELGDWPRRLSRDVPPVVELLGPRFRQLPENQSYPLGGLLVGSTIRLVGLDAFRDHLYAASAATWEEACRRAGTTAKAVEAAFQTARARNPAR